MAFVYIGTSAFAAAVLERLALKDRLPQLIISRADARRGRGRGLQRPPVAQAANEYGIELLQPVAIADVEDRIDAVAGSGGPVALCAYGELILEPLLSRHEILNIHPSLLPRWRGAAPIERAMLAGDRQTGVSIMRLVDELDSGPIYAQRAEPIEPDDDYGTLSARLQQIGADLLLAVIDRRPQPTAQPEVGVTYADKLTASDRRIDVDGDPAAALRAVRALHPHIGARMAVAGATGEYLRVLEAELDRQGHFQPLRVRPAGGRDMGYDDYLRGRQTSG